MMRSPTASTSCSRVPVVLEGAAQTCGKHVEILERRKNIDPSVDSFGRLKKESVMQKDKGVASGIYTQQLGRATTHTSSSSCFRYQ